MCQGKGVVGTVPGWKMERGFGFESRPMIRCCTWKGGTQKWGVLKVVNNLRMFG
ncbi:hypothetical protein AAG906_007846 [Vitis piasezkii]